MLKIVKVESGFVFCLFFACFFLYIYLFITIHGVKILQRECFFLKSGQDTNLICSLRWCDMASWAVPLLFARAHTATFEEDFSQPGLGVVVKAEIRRLRFRALISENMTLWRLFHFRGRSRCSKWQVSSALLPSHNFVCLFSLFVFFCFFLRTRGAKTLTSLFHLSSKIPAEWNIAGYGEKIKKRKFSKQPGTRPHTSVKVPRCAADP